MDKGDGFSPRKATYNPEILLPMSSSEYITSSTMMITSVFSSTIGPSPPVQSPLVSACNGDGIWPETPINETALGSCYKGIVNGTYSYCYAGWLVLHSP